MNVAERLLGLLIMQSLSSPISILFLASARKHMKTATHIKHRRIRFKVTWHAESELQSLGCGGGKFRAGGFWYWKLLVRMDWHI